MKMQLAIQEFLKDIEIRKYTPRTIRQYTNCLNIFFSYAQSEGVEDTEDLSMALIKGYLGFLSGSGRKATYINSLLKTAKSYIQYCYTEDYGAFDTRRRFVWAKEEKPVIRAFQPQDVKRMLSSCSGRDFMALRDRCILTMLFETGIRCLELCSICKGDIHGDYIIINGKNHKQRVVPITPILGKAMIKYEVVRDQRFPLPKNQMFFVSCHGNMLTNSAVEHILKNHGEGIEGVRVSPHTCRHTFAQMQVKMGTDLYTISRLLGHENIRITQTYLESLRDEDIIQIAKGRSVLENL